MGSDSCPQDHLLPRFPSPPQPGDFSLLVRIKFGNALLLSPLLIFVRWCSRQGKPRVSKAFTLSIASSSCNCEAAALGANLRCFYIWRPTTHLLSKIHSESELTPQESEIACTRPHQYPVLQVDPLWVGCCPIGFSLHVLPVSRQLTCARCPGKEQRRIIFLFSKILLSAC